MSHSSEWEWEWGTVMTRETKYDDATGDEGLEVAVEQSWTQAG